MKPITRQENAKRAERMERLFFLDGRDKKSHPRHGVFSGLNEEVELYKKWKDIFWRLDHHLVDW